MLMMQWKMLCWVSEIIISYISAGFVKVQVVDDRGFRTFLDYKCFEDVALNRDLLLHQLGII